MKNYILIVLVLVSLNVLSQETQYQSKIDSVNNLIADNENKIKLLQLKNEELKSEIRIYKHLNDSVLIATNKSIKLHSNLPMVFYNDSNLTNTEEKIPINSVVGLLEDLGKKYKVIFNGRTGYVLKYGFETDTERQTKIVKINKDKATKQKDIEDRAKEMIKKYGPHYGKIVNEGRYAIGMTKQMILDSIGNPKDINRTVGSWGSHEQWVYENFYIYFENGKVTSFQD